jgi:uncharacterized protein (TIGR01777 family)
MHNDPMRIVIAGGSGFLGRALAADLLRDGHDVQVLTRRPRGTHDVIWTAAPEPAAWMNVVDGADAVVNLAGEPLDRRWTPDRKRALRASRLDATTALVAALRRAARRPSVFLSGSAIGIYGTRGSEPLDEHAPPGSDFTARLCREWEASAAEANDLARVVLLRTGLVLGREGGVLPRLARPFQFFAGGPLGSGRQYYSWIHRRDWVAMVRWAMTNGAVSGPLNVTAPHPVTNAELARALGAALHRPALVPAPAFALRLLLGEMADALVLGGQRVVPRKALSLGFSFAYDTIDAALRALYLAA